MPVQGTTALTVIFSPGLLVLSIIFTDGKITLHVDSITILAVQGTKF